LVVLIKQVVLGSSLKRGLLTYGGGQLARGIGGAGFQQGFNPFSNVSFSGGIMSGLGQTFTSPVSGAPMFGQAQFAPDPNQLTPTQQAITSGTGDIDSYGSIRDYQLQTRPNPVTKDLTASEMAQQAGKTLSERTATGASKSYGDIFKSLTSGNFTEMGNAAKELGGKALKDIYTTKDGSLDKSALLATLVTIPSYLDAKKAADDAGLEEFDEAAYNAERDKYMSKYQGNLPASAFGIENKANGGRIGYREGTPREGIVSLTDEDSGVIYRDPDTEEPITKEEFLRRAQEDEDKQYMSPTDQGSGVIYRNEKGEPITKNEWLRLTSEAPSITLPEKDIKGIIPPNRPMEMKKKRVMEILRKGGGALEKETLENLLNKYGSIENRAQGGRIGYMYGSEVPVRRNEGGITELDYRNTGGFVPIGVKEKADDVPAMLSKNEFVFTADAVRAAGGGSVQKGAQKMYNTMKMLEGQLV
jgi:hypothetical protein